jgi:hypothetical protein
MGMTGAGITRSAADEITDAFLALGQTVRLDLGRQLLDLIPATDPHQPGGNFLRTYVSRLAKHRNVELTGDHHRRWLARQLGTAVVTGEASRLRDILGHDVEPWATFHRALVTLLDHDADVITWATADPRLTQPVHQ